MAPPPGPPGATAAAPLPAKLSLLRAQVLRTDRVLDMFARITSLASGSVNVELFAANRRTSFKAPISDTKINVRRSIPKSQADMGTGIVTIDYPGDSDTRPQTVRLRAASRHADLTVQRPTITDGRLRASGTISSLARGVVRLQLQYVVDGVTVTLPFSTPISSGRWSLNEKLTQAAQNAIARRTGTVHSYVLFTGYLAERMRGEMLSYEVLGDR